MRLKPIVLFAVLVISAWFINESALAQDAVNENTIFGVLHSVYPELKSEDIEIKMIKHLNSRTKVNLDIEGKNAILYLKWRRYRNNYRWWFERDAEQSLVFLSKTTTFAREVNVHTLGADSRETADAVANVTGGDKAAAVTEAKVEKQKSAEGEKTEAAAVAPAKSETASAEKPETPVQPEVIPPAQKVDKPETAKLPESSELPGKSDKPGQEEIPEKTEEPGQLETAAEPDMTDIPPEATPVLPVEIATGPEAQVSEFLITLVATIGRGEEESYEKFLLRKEEMTGSIEDEDYRGAVNRWKGQFEAIHGKLAEAGQFEIRKINLDRPQTYQIERATIQELSRKIVSVRQVYSGARIEMLMNGKEVYVRVGGLIRTDGGWRIGGLVELVEPLAFR